MARKKLPQDAAVFLRARFAGGRFDHHTLPLEVLPDLASYRRLVIEVAKHIFKTTHGDRVRVPKGFEESFGLAVLRVQGGKSSTADLVVSEREARAQTQLFPRYPEFEQARELINSVIREVSHGRPIPTDFPEHLCGLFNPFGQSLLEDEFIELSSPDGSAVKYTDSIRRWIVLSEEAGVENSLDSEFTLNGGEVSTGIIHLLDPDARSFDFQPTSKFEFEEAYRRARGKVRLVGSGVYEASGRLRRILSANFDFNRPAFHLELRAAFTEAKDSYPRDDADTAQVWANLRTLQSHLESSSDPNLELGRPFIYILEDEEISVEWTNEEWEASVQMKLSGNSVELHALNTASGQSLWDTLALADTETLHERLGSFLKAVASAAQEEE